MILNVSVVFIAVVLSLNLTGIQWLECKFSYWKMSNSPTSVSYLMHDWGKDMLEQSQITYVSINWILLNINSVKLKYWVYTGFLMKSGILIKSVYHFNIIIIITFIIITFIYRNQSKSNKWWISHLCFITLLLLSQNLSNK